jgi:PKD repeat protein
MMASKISSHFLKISLDNSNISVQYDNKKRVNFSLYLDSKEIIKKEIEISPALIITDLDPKTAPLGIAVQFNAIYSGNFSSFLWDFGDNTTIQTNNSKASHAYSSIKPFTLKVTAINNFGNYSKEFTINVTNSKDYINQTLSSYEKYISSLGARISSYPALVKTSLESYLDLDSIKNKVAQSKLKYNSAPNDTQNLLEVIDSLEGINIPFNTSSSRIIFGPTFSNIEFSDAEKFNLISGESFKAEGLKDAVLEWNQKSINLEQEQIEYYMVYKNKSLLAGTYFKLDVIPVSDLDKVYVFIATKQGNNVYSNNNLIEKDGNYGLVLSDLKKDSQINLEIFITGDNSYKEIPFLFFPQSNKLAYSLNYAKCDFDDKCESGETRLNCRNDCMDWQFVSIGLTVLLLIFFIVYIFVQEWYKRRYESWLFRERHDLFNLINFISHAEEKSMKKEVICSMLKKKKWTGEQITFAYKRFKGERTGMWEIPILRRREAREVKEELEIRRNQQNINKPRNS